MAIFHTITHSHGSASGESQWATANLTPAIAIHKLLNWFGLHHVSIDHDNFKLIL